MKSKFAIQSFDSKTILQFSKFFAINRLAFKKMTRIINDENEKFFAISRSIFKKKKRIINYENENDISQFSSKQTQIFKFFAINHSTFKKKRIINDENENDISQFSLKRTQVFKFN